MIVMAPIQNCPTCGRPFDPMLGTCLECGLTSEESVLAWVAGTDEPGKVSEDRTCPSCGYEGEFTVGSDASLCPACLAEYPRFLAEPMSTMERIVHCPNCHLAIGISAEDRDKTIVCVRCKYFLGCVFKSDRQARRESKRRKL